MTTDSAAAETLKQRQRKALRKALPPFVAILIYPFPLNWLWERTSYPESFGIHTGLGKGGVYLHWWYSYLLLSRHQPWDVVTLTYMWPGIIGLFIWTFRSMPKAKTASTAANSPTTQRGDV